MIITNIEELEEMPLGRSTDLSKKNFEHFEAIKRIKPIKKTTSRDAVWLCKCECGNFFISNSGNLQKAGRNGCGHLQKEQASNSLSLYQKQNKGKPKKDYVGYTSGKLTVISFSHIDENRHSVWNCKCECGAEIQVASPELASKEVKSCGCLKQSYGSYKIEQIFINNNIPYEKEKTFDDCRFPSTNALARFDFYVNNVLIEFDGKQHYEYVGGYYTLDEFHNIQERDRYKNNWCKENNIKLVRIPYYEEDKITFEYLKEKIYEG